MVKRAFGLLYFCACLSLKPIFVGALFVFVELCPLGNLENYLRSHREEYLDEISAMHYCNTPEQVRYLWTKISRRCWLFALLGWLQRQCLNLLCIIYFVFYSLLISSNGIRTKNLLTWSIQMCSGMDYLSSKKVTDDRFFTYQRVS